MKPATFFPDSHARAISPGLKRVNLKLDPDTPTPFCSAAIMKARTDRYQTQSDDREDNLWHREKE